MNTTHRHLSEAARYPSVRFTSVGQCARHTGILFLLLVFTSNAHCMLLSASFSGHSFFGSIDRDTRETTVEGELRLDGTFEIEIFPDSTDGIAVVSMPFFRVTVTDLLIVDQNHHRDEDFYYARYSYETDTAISGVERDYRAASFSVFPIAFFFRTRTPGEFPLEQVELSATTDSLDDFAGLNISQVLELVVERGNPLDTFNFIQASITTPEVGTFYYTVDKFVIQESASTVPLPSAAWLFLTALLALLRARDGGSLLTADPA